MKVPLDQIFLILDFRTCFGDTVRTAPSVEQSFLGHGTVYCPSTDIDAFLKKRQLDSVDPIVVIIRVLFKDLFDFDQKKFPLAGLVLVFQPSVIAGFTDFQDETQLFYSMGIFSGGNEFIAARGFYFFRSFAKKPRASFSISFASRSSAFSFSSRRMRSSAFTAQLSVDVE